MRANARGLAILLTLLGGCAASQMSVYPQYLGSSPPVARPDTGRLVLFLAGDALPRTGDRVGTLWVTFEQGSTSLNAVLERVRPLVRKMGGDAVILDSVRQVVVMRRETSTGTVTSRPDPFGGGPFGPGRAMTVIVGAGTDVVLRDLRWAVALSVIAWKPRP